ncbi:hypothetical protein HBA54_22915 [Pelagibius litoralis]|uniref:Uncharacterized protein n=2 Tax=Pelagibius litoralis TaxID=374515 RepID=A0A967F1S3_9PROT|nr:hypothetical protein [Pelagibius litoralis]
MSIDLCKGMGYCVVAFLRPVPDRHTGCSMEISSTAFSSGERIPLRHSCQGPDVSPLLSWQGALAATRSFVLFCNDPDAS